MVKFKQSWQWIHNRNDNHWLYWYEDNGDIPGGDDWFDEDIGVVTKTGAGYLADPYGSPRKMFKDLTSAKRYVERYATPKKPVRAVRKKAVPKRTVRKR